MGRLWTLVWSLGTTGFTCDSSSRHTRTRWSLLLWLGGL